MGVMIRMTISCRDRGVHMGMMIRMTISCRDRGVHMGMMIRRTTVKINYNKC